MSEEFIRCPECGNLNIQGSTSCVFCNNSLEDVKASTKEKTKSEIPEVSEVTEVEEIPIPEGEPEKASMPKIPDISVTEQKPVKEVQIEEMEEVEASSTRKFFMISFLSVLVAVVHYLLNLLVSVIAVIIKNPNVDAYPLTGDLNLSVGVNAVSVILGIPFALIIGYAIGKIIRRYTAKKSSLIGWFSYAVLLDLIINVGIAIGLVLAFDALNHKDVLLIILAGAAFIFVGVSVITLFIPMISGSFLAFNKIDKVFFPKKYADY
jgi:hypothetical protein